MFNSYVELPEGRQVAKMQVAKGPILAGSSEQL